MLVFALLIDGVVGARVGFNGVMISGMRVGFDVNHNPSGVLVIVRLVIRLS